MEPYGLKSAPYVTRRPGKRGMNFAQSGQHCTTSMMFVNVVCMHKSLFVPSLLVDCCYILPKFDLNVRELEEHVVTTCHLFRILKLMMFQHDIITHTCSQCLTLVGIRHVL